MKTGPRLPLILNSYEQSALLAQPNRKAPTGLRNLCMLKLMLKAGLRAGEIIALRIDDIDWAEGIIYLRESGAASKRALWLDDEVLELLARWRNIKIPGSNYLFTTLRGNRLNDRYLREMVKRQARKAGINKDVYPNLLRSTFAVNLIRETRDVQLVQQALGHRNPDAIKNYTKLLFNEIYIVNNGNYVGKFCGMPAQKDQVFDQSNINMHGQLSHDKYQPFSESATWKAADRESIKNEEGEEVDLNRTGSENIKASSAGDKSNSTGSDESTFNASINSIGKGCDLDENSYKQQRSEIEHEYEPPIVAEESLKEKKPIPALKCSQCNYILRYQEDCPQCGASFISILRHWGKNI